MQPGLQNEPEYWQFIQKIGVLVGWASITQYHRVGGLNNTCIYLTVLETKKSKVKVFRDSVSDESSLPVI